MASGKWQLRRLDSAKVAMCDMERFDKNAVRTCVDHAYNRSKTKSSKDSSRGRSFLRITLSRLSGTTSRLRLRLELLDHALDGGRVGTRDVVGLLAALEEGEGGHGADAELLGEVGQGVDVELVEAHIAVRVRVPFGCC